MKKDETAAENTGSDVDDDHEIPSSHDFYNREFESRHGYNPVTHKAATLDDWFRDMNDVMEGRKNVGEIGLPRPQHDAGGILIFLLRFPVLFLLFSLKIFIKDPFSGWKRWRVAGLVASIALAVLTVIASVAAELLFDTKSHSDILENIGSFGLLGVLLFIWPRFSALVAITITAIGILATVLNAIF